MIDSVAGSAIQGIQRAQEGLKRNASEIASASALSNKQGGKDMTRSLVEMHQHKTNGQASVKVLKAADEMVGTLLDEMA